MYEKLFHAEISDIRLSVASIVGEEQSQSGVSEEKLTSYQKLHQHVFYEIFFTTDTLSVTTETEQLSYTNAVVIVPPWLNHFVAAERSQICALYFRMEKIKGKTTGLYRQISALFNAGITTLPLTEDESFYSAHLFDSIKGKLPQEQTEHLIPLLFSDIFFRMIPQNRLAQGSAENYSRFVNTLDSFISSHYCEDIHMEDLARELCLCSRQVSRIISREYGCTFSQLVNKKRLYTACMMLKHTDLPIRNIAVSVGFKNENYFSTSFSSKYGISPTQYRENNKAMPFDISHRNDNT